MTIEPVPVNELVTILVIMAGAMVAERIVGSRRFWTAVQWVGIVAFVIVVVIGLWSEVAP